MRLQCISCVTNCYLKCHKCASIAAKMAHRGLSRATLARSQARDQSAWQDDQGFRDLDGGAQLNQTFHSLSSKSLLLGFLLLWKGPLYGAWFQGPFRPCTWESNLFACSSACRYWSQLSLSACLLTVAGLGPHDFLSVVSLLVFFLVAALLRVSGTQICLLTCLLTFIGSGPIF